MKLLIFPVLLSAVMLCLMAAFAVEAIPVTAAASDNASTIYLQNWGHSSGQSCASGWGHSVWVPSKK